MLSLTSISLDSSTPFVSTTTSVHVLSLLLAIYWWLGGV